MMALLLERYSFAKAFLVRASLERQVSARSLGGAPADRCAACCAGSASATERRGPS